MEVTNRGFVHGEEIPSAYGGFVKVYQSSSIEPHIWVFVTCPSNLNDQRSTPVESVGHLTLENARQLRDQLTYLIDLED